MAKKLSNAARLEELFGGTSKLAAAIGCNKAVPSRWKSAGPKGNKGRVPAHWNLKIIKAAQKRKINSAEVSACLDQHVCPTCDQLLPAGKRIDKRKLPR